jgi:hypothetical protein
MIFAKAKTESACKMHEVFAGQGSPVSLAFRLAPKQSSHDESCDWPKGQTDGQAAARLPGFVFPAVRDRLSLVGSKCESNEFSSGEEESFGSESRVNSQRVSISR